MDYTKVTAWSTLGLVIFAGATLIVGIVGLIARTLPTTGAIRETMSQVGNKIADKSVKSIEDCLKDVIHVIISYKENPSKARVDVYKKAFEKAKDKGYVFHIPKGYVRTHRWRDEKLLSSTIENTIGQIVRDSNEQDQMDLMYLVLSDERIRETLLSKQQIGSEPLTLYEKIGVIGGYIGEEKWEKLEK